MKNIYIYSNSTRSDNRQFDESFIPDNSDNSLHVFLNDLYAYTSNYEKFKDLKHIMIIMAYDNVALLKFMQIFFETKVQPKQFILCTTDYYYIIQPNIYQHDGIRHGFLNPLIDNTKSLTCGARAIIICNELYLNNNNITLVNFADQRDSTYKQVSCHAWDFEAQLFSNLKHIYI